MGEFSGIIPLTRFQYLTAVRHVMRTWDISSGVRLVATSGLEYRKNSLLG